MLCGYSCCFISWWMKYSRNALINCYHFHGRYSGTFWARAEHVNILSRWSKDCQNVGCMLSLANAKVKWIKWHSKICYICWRYSSESLKGSRNWEIGITTSRNWDSEFLSLPDYLGWLWKIFQSLLCHWRDCWEKRLCMSGKEIVSKGFNNWSISSLMHVI